MKQKENTHYIRPDLMKQFFSSNESNDRKPFDFQLMLTEAFLKELAEKMAASIIQPSISFPFFPMSSPMQSPVGN